MNNKKIETYFDETLEYIELIKEYYMKTRKQEAIAQLRDIEKSINSFILKNLRTTINKSNNG